MKKIISVLLLIILCAVPLSSCTKENNAVTDKINVLATVFPPFDLARAVGNEKIDVHMLMSPGTDSHSYSGDNPTDILKIARCDLFIYVGGKSESIWVEKVLSSIEKSGEPLPRVLNLSDYCDLMDESDSGILQTDTHSHSSDKKETHSHSTEHPDGHYECSFDEHVWTSPDNAEKMTDAIARTLCEMDKANSEYYLSNAKKEKEKLSELDAEFTVLFSDCENKTLIFADRFPFAYFANSYGLECYAAFSGCASENEPSPTTIASLAKIIEEKNINYIFYIETSKSTVPDALFRATGAEPLLLHSCHVVSEKELREGVSYISLMKSNLNNLRKALSNND